MCSGFCGDMGITGSIFMQQHQLIRLQKWEKKPSPCIWIRWKCGIVIHQLGSTGNSHCGKKQKLYFCYPDWSLLNLHFALLSLPFSFAPNRHPFYQQWTTASFRVIRNNAFLFDLWPHGCWGRQPGGKSMLIKENDEWYPASK